MKYCIQCALGLGKQPERSPWDRMSMKEWSAQHRNLGRLSFADLSDMGPSQDPIFNG